ncbi:MAG: hypothetical protein E5V54_00920 [Mesorhizobium sp.]|uniref:hypothetical protein n=1 Tax=unclassified Mesorhizobium TaxID=325217 RepID=UPI000FCA912A|nr:MULTISPECIES: hypothetical protein [unclassified Mesorhizobium]RVC95857.1 hypothetical protein EN739_11210 [Mesorhizobium sp. M2A.F.Ca.ET.017.03.2.1]TIW58865.1 MAG: hypothetical protein E5V54_00920 [Mesorhizobium sp.]TIW84253.1 MAG: hypothetical protein E5V53_00660 [Mesorhizobium sp.]
MRRAGTPNRPGGWRGSAAQIAVGRAAIRAWNAKRHLAPKCGAKAKSHGGPCRQIAMANGRCWAHGGRVPSGENWHKPVWPNRDASDAEAKLNRKLNDLQRAAAKRAKRVAAMTPEERAAHEQWQKTHKPGPAAARARARRERQEAKQVREIFSARPDPVAIPEISELERLIAERKAEIDRLTDANSKTDDKGAFG